MAYATALDMLLYYQAKELAKTATPKSSPTAANIVPECLEALIKDENTSAWTSEQVETAQAGLEAINEALADAEKLMTSYFARRYQMPLNDATIAVNPVKRGCGDIARYFIAERKFKDITEVTKRYNDVMTWLLDVGSGKAGLMIKETIDSATTSPFKASFGQGVSRTDWGTY
ncbi:DUF1320 domain-containing protein [Beggiatoa leptomitoformis]|uniref:DUF1320 domain-containing protein n=1 Tax=Beggiatoa leptomitoformis TaxID=288004 RepID=A0A2N9YH55_9GAMM|nr:DUF1320 domain-containing protein [Beggiatoa leptomitoformis]ALG67877.1 DUF1320 domain-containing protein [Beggiatoa leptomitoformis]AUI69862.1 DUF1320 domain-containing protein [Beggiatoa leptomitoformis]